METKTCSRRKKKSELFWNHECRRVNDAFVERGPAKSVFLREVREVKVGGFGAYGSRGSVQCGDIACDTQGLRFARPHGQHLARLAHRGAEDWLCGYAQKSEFSYWTNRK